MEWNRVHGKSIEEAEQILTQYGWKITNIKNRPKHNLILITYKKESILPKEMEIEFDNNVASGCIERKLW